MVAMWGGGEAARSVAEEWSNSSTESSLALALEYFRGGRHSAAEEIYAAVLAAEPDHPLCLHHLGLIAHHRGDHASAADCVKRAIALRPDYVEALSNLGAIYRALSRTADAIDVTTRAIALQPDFAQAHSNLGNAFEDEGRLGDALDAYRRAGALNQGFVPAYSNAANVLRKLGRKEEAIAVCQEIIAQRPDAPEPYFSLGNVLKDLRQAGPAMAAYRKAIALRPDFAEVYANLGNLLQEQEAFEEAAEVYAKAIAFSPRMAAAHASMGTALERLGRLPEAMAAYRMAVELDPERLDVRVWLHHKRRIICDWSGIEGEEAELLRLAASGASPPQPFPLLSMATTPAGQLRAAIAFAAKSGQEAQAGAFPRANEGVPGKLRVGFLSNDFCRHATALLVAELIELHDRERFEFFAYSHGADDHSAIGARLRKGFDHFVDVRPLSDEDAARRIHGDGIHILIDMKGYTSGARTGIAARRPAPVQASFLGFPGTMGVDFIDYIIADPFVLPMDQQDHFSEKIVHLPHCYQPNDATRPIAELTPTRLQCGLPESGFVFCSFNNSYKITPAFFDIWMRLLLTSPGSVLWLLDSNALIKDNLRNEARRRGVDPDRLVFAPKQASPEHLARHRLADLFLDTLPYNAHTTASDALWAGLPVLTCVGDTFAGRVAGSLLQAAGLPELATGSLEDYERRALELARNAGLLRQIREKLLSGKRASPLFDSKRYARNFEAALTKMWALHVEGHEPRAFAAPDAAGPTREPPPLARVRYERCPLCGGADIPATLGADCTKHALYQPVVPPVMNWHVCANCGHVFTEGYFDAAALAVIFARTHQNQTVGHDMERQRAVSARMVERVAPHAPGGRWLDVGFGNGSLLFTAEEWGFTPVGLDLREDNVAVLKSLGYEAHCLPVESLDHDGRYAVVSMADVLEHMPFPRTGLDAAHRLLRPGGALFVSMPNMDTMVWRLLHANNVNPYWGEIEHYHNFTRRRLCALLDEHGFEPVAYHVSERYRVCMEVIARKR